MSNRNVPITRLGKFFSEKDFDLEIRMGEEWLLGDLNFTLVLTLSDGIKFKTPVEFKAFVQVNAPENKFLGNSKINQVEPGNVRISVYIKHLEDLGIDINFGDYIAYYETENKVRYYVVNNDGRVTSDNKHTYGGYKPYYRTILASPVTENEFRGL